MCDVVNIPPVTLTAQDISCYPFYSRSSWELISQNFPVPILLRVLLGLNLSENFLVPILLRVILGDLVIFFFCFNILYEGHSNTLVKGRQASATTDLPA